MYAYSPADWEGLFLAGAGASAALAGLVNAVLGAWVLLVEILR